MNRLVIFGSDNRKRENRRHWELLMASSNNNSMKMMDFMLTYYDSTKDIILPYDYRLDYAIINGTLHSPNSNNLITINAVDMVSYRELFSYERPENNNIGGHMIIDYYSIDGFLGLSDRNIGFFMITVNTTAKVNIRIGMTKVVNV